WPRYCLRKSRRSKEALDEADAVLPVPQLDRERADRRRDRRLGGDPFHAAAPPCPARQDRAYRPREGRRRRPRPRPQALAVAPATHPGRPLPKPRACTKVAAASHEARARATA